MLLEPLFQDPGPVTGTPDGLMGEAVGGLEVPQHIVAQNDPHDALIILRYVS